MPHLWDDAGEEPLLLLRSASWQKQKLRLGRQRRQWQWLRPAQQDPREPPLAEQLWR